VEIDADGWKVINYAPVNFLKNSVMIPLPLPVHGDVHLLKKYIKVKDETDYKLIIGFILGCFQPYGGYPILNMMGPEGSAKTTTANLLRTIIDPSNSEEDTLTNDIRNLAILAVSQHLLSFGNISMIKQEISNMLCKLSTGGGFPTRSLFTNSDILVFKSKNPIILNGIIDFVNRSDLASRTLKVDLEKIHKHERKTEYDIYTQFNKDYPSILGGIYSVLSDCLKKYKNVKLTNLMRLADFTKWVTAAHEKLGWQIDDFYNAYNNKSLDDIYNRLTSQMFSKCLINLLSNEFQKNISKDKIFLTNDNLQTNIKAMLEEDEMKNYKWANSEVSFGITMRLLVSDFAEIGIQITPKKSGKRGYEFKITDESIKENLLAITSEFEEDEIEKEIQEPNDSNNLDINLLCETF
jgi:putative DNA primase/helicase